MGSISDIFAVARLALDSGGFEAQAVGVADKAGKSAGDKMSKQLSSKLSSGLAKGIGGALGGIFGIAASQANELNNAVANFTAQTGLAGKAADDFAESEKRLFASNVQGWGEISDLLIGLQQHMGLTGGAAEKAATQFLDFSRVAGVDAKTAIGTFDELVDAGVVKIGDMGSMMDKLTAAHQKFGVNISDVTGALVKFAPAMTAFGISTDDALGYITMFSEMGLNAEVSTKAFNLALQKVKSPDELKRLIQDISNTEDPFKRAQMASDLFGKRAGVQLANALKPGSGGIEAWKVSAEDAAGATQKAGDALDNTWGKRFTLLMHQAGATLAGFGSNFGPLLMVAAQLGPKITAALSASLGSLAGPIAKKIVSALAGSTAAAVGAATVEGAATGTALVQSEAAAIIWEAPEIGGAVAAQGPEAAAGAAVAGRMAGTAFGVAMAAGLTVAAAGAVVLAYNVINDGLQKQTDELTGKTAEWAKGVTDAELAAMKAEVESKKGEVPTLLGWDILGGKDKVQQVADEIGHEQARRYEKAYKDELNKLATGSDLIDAMIGSPTELQSRLDELKAKLAALGTVSLWDPEKMLAKQQLDQQITWTQEALDGMNSGIVAGQQKAQADIAAAAELGYRGIPDGMRAAQALATTEVRKGLDDQAAAITAGRGQLAAAWTAALSESTAAQKIAIELQENAASQAEARKVLAAANSTNEAKRTAQLQLIDLQNAHALLLVEDAQYGTDAEKRVKLTGLLESKAMLDGLASTNNDTRLMWQRVRATTQEELAKLPPMSYSEAWKSGAAFTQGLIDAANQYKPKPGGGSGGPVTNPYAPPPGGIDYHDLPSMASGGVVPGAVGQPVPILAHGGEVVTPAGGPNVTINFPNYVGSKQDLVDAITQQLRLTGG